jgi:hypothetical protein
MMTSWSDLYRQLWMHAARSRGTRWRDDDELDHASGPSIPEWPRTTVGDVVAIVMMVDPLLGSLPVRPGGYGVTRLWQTAVIELESLAAVHPGGEYSHNRTFWSTLLTVVAYLETRDAPLPHDDTWDALRAELAARAGERNASGPTPRTLTATTFPAMWDAQHAELAKLRGIDRIDASPGEASETTEVPRTNKADALRLAAYWGKALIQLQVKVMTGGAASPTGFADVQTHWQAVSADVDRFAKSGNADEVYPNNHELWGATHLLAATLATAGVSPVPYELDAPKPSAPKPSAPELSSVSEAAERVVHAIGDIAREAGAGMLSAAGKPLLIGGGVLVGLFLLLRHGRDHEAR